MYNIYNDTNNFSTILISARSVIFKNLQVGFLQGKKNKEKDKMFLDP